MTMTIEEALAQAEEISTNSDWTILTGYVNKPMYSDSEVSVDLYSKTIGDLSGNVSTTEENNSEYIAFIMDRYHDGVDLSTMLIQLQYELEDGSGSIDGVVNAYMNEYQIKFGWAVPNAVTQQSRTIKIMIFCTGELDDGNSYLLKTLPVEYTINKTLNIGGSIPQPDENWYLQFVSMMNEKVTSASNFANTAETSATEASERLAEIQVIQNDINQSKNTVQTLAGEVQNNAMAAETSADAAKVSEETAKSWAEKAQELSGVNYASKELAGIVSPQDVYVNPENGHMSIITQTTEKTLSNSYAGGIKVNEIDGKSEQFSGTITDESGNEIEVPNPDYPQDILSVGGSSINMLDFYGTDVIKNHYAGDSGNIAPSSVGNDTWIVKVKPNSIYSFSRKNYENIGSFRAISFSQYPTTDIYGTLICFVDKNVLSGNFTTLADTKYIALYSDKINQESGVEKAELMINEGAIPLPYVPYGVTVALRTHGKNLCDGRWRQGNSSNTTTSTIVTSVIAIPCKIGDVFSVSCQGMRVALFIVSRQAYVNPEGMIQSTGLVNDSATITCQYDGFLKIQLIRTNLSAITPVEAQSMEVMWNKGEVMPYEPYQESVAYLSETLRGIGDVKDRIVKKDGVWQIERNIGEVTFNGSEAWAANSVYPETTRGISISDMKSNCSLMSNKYINQRTLGAVDGIYAASSINVTDMRYSTVEEFKASLQDSPLIVLYELATPTYEPLPESEQIALHSLESYDTVTYISCDSEVEPTIDVEYGTSRVGGYTLEAWNTSKRNEIEITAMKATHTTTTEEEVTA